MGMLRWKIRRELNRIGQQLQAIPEYLIEPWLRRRHDATRPQWLQALAGQAPLGDKVALLLLYQPRGVSAATRWTCEHLVSKGYAPLVISNAPLTPADRALLEPVVWRMAQRPNFGYDFGGYRDGLWLLEHLGVAPAVLLILNDSIWFPLQAHETLLDRMEAADADFVGALQLDPLRQTEGVPPKKRPFFGSFFLMFKRPALEHPAFKRFWRHYRITSNKYKTIRRGERGLSHALMDAGVRSSAVYTRGMLDAHFAGLDAAALRDALADLVTIDERIEADIAACLATADASEAWLERARQLARRATEKQNVLATAPVASLTTFGVPYLKKARDRNNLKALALIRDRMRANHLPIAHESVLQEIDQALHRPPPSP